MKFHLFMVDTMLFARDGRKEKNSWGYGYGINRSTLNMFESKLGRWSGKFQK
jgi:hypothetical protein